MSGRRCATPDSTAGVLDADMVRSMAGNPLVMALANPDPDIS